MDALQHPHRFTRPPIPDPQQQQQKRPPQGPPPPWYPQFQYQSPAPPQWAPPISDHHHQHHLLNYQQQQPSPALPPHLTPYPAHHPHHYPPSPLPPPHVPPPPPYPLPNQTWGNQNWPRQQGWDYPDRNIPNTNEEDWAARAKAWAAAKAAVENQQTQSQFTPVGRMEEHSHAYHDQYQQIADPLLTEAHKSSLLPSVRQQFSFSVTTSHRPQVDQLQDSASFVSGRASFYVPDGSVSYDARDGAFSADSNPFAPPQENVLTNSSIYQQEVPSSYSSIPGTTEAGNENEQFHKALVSSISSHQEQLNPQTTLPAAGCSASVEQPHFMHWDQSVEAINNPNDREPIFDHVSPHDHDSRQKASYMYPNPAGHSGDVDRIAAVSSVHAWTPAVVAGGVFSPIPPVPSGPQFDPTFVSHSSAPGQPAPVFGGIPRPSFRPTIPSAGACFGLGAGTALHPTTAFPGDSNEVFNASERPKKASVPNWLREEIIKKKVAIASSSIQGHTANDSFHLSGTEADDESFKEGDETDSGSVDSTHSAEGEEDDDDVEAARSAAINLEIKHILTEVLLKVTDELFDEIATKVLSEDDMAVEVDNGTDSARHKISPPPAVLTPKASAKVLVPVVVKNAKINDATEKSSSSSPGDVLGLGNYASEEDEEVQSSSMRSARQINGDAHRRSSNDRTSEDVLMEEKGTKLAEVEEQEETLQNSPLKYNGEGCPRKKGIHADNELVYDDGAAAATRAMPRVSGDQFIVKDSKMVEVSLKQTYDFESKDNVDGKFYMKHESECGNAVDLKSTTDEFQARDDLTKSKKNDGNEGKRSSVSKVIVIEADDAVKVKAKQKHLDSGEPRRGKDRNVGKEQTDERNNGLKERIEVRDVKPEEKVRESDSRKSSKHSNTVKDDRKDTEKSRRVRAKEEDNRKRERTRDEEDRSRHRDPRDSRRYKRQHSPSVSRGKNVRDNSLADNISDSSDETSDNSRQRKLRSNKRSLSPSPVRSPRRQVSRSHSKHSQRRHSPYSSQETRRRRSRSGTPVRRRR